MPLPYNIHLIININKPINLLINIIINMYLYITMDYTMKNHIIYKCFVGEPKNTNPTKI